MQQRTCSTLPRHSARDTKNSVAAPPGAVLEERRQQQQQQQRPQQQQQKAWRMPRYKQARLSPWLLIGALVVLAQLTWQPVGAQLALEQYPVNWVAINATVGTTTTKDLYGDGCACSLLNGTCTPNCCCDYNCLGSVRQQFFSSGTCLFNETQVDNLAYCTEQGFSKVNLPTGNYYYVQKQVADSAFATQVLCIVRDSNPSLGARYVDPAPGDVADNVALATCPTTSPLPSGNAGNYTFRDQVMVEMSANGTRTPFVLPAAVLTAECQDLQQLGFLQRVPRDLSELWQTCQRTFATGADLTAACGPDTDLLSPVYYTNLQWPTVATALSTLPTNLSQLVYVNPVTGALNSTNQSVAAPAAVAGPPVGCSRAVTRVEYVFTYVADDESDAALLTAVAVSLTTTDLEMPADGSPLVLPYQVAVTWIPVETGVTVVERFSGSPGYRVGFPVLAGVQVTQSNISAVSRYRKGLMLPGPGAGGMCSAQDLGSLAFGFNTSTSCGVSLSLAALKTYCSGTAPGSILSNILRGYMTSITQNLVMVGVWGDSDIASSEQWVPLVVDGWPSQALDWDDTSNTCTNAMTGFNIRLVTGLTWANGAAQTKVLYAQLCFTTDTWTWTSDPAAPAQQFMMNFTAQFIAKPQPRPMEAVRPMPPLFAPLPPDIFYPFLTSSSAASSPAAAGPVAALLRLALLPVLAVVLVLA